MRLLLTIIGLALAAGALAQDTPRQARTRLEAAVAAREAARQAYVEADAEFYAAVAAATALGVGVEYEAVTAQLLSEVPEIAGGCEAEVVITALYRKTAVE